MRINRWLALVVGGLVVMAGCASQVWAQNPAIRSPLKVFILAGQSNMQGHAHIRTLDSLRTDPTTSAMHQALFQTDGQPRVFDSVQIVYLSSEGVKAGPLTVGFGATSEKMGPELTFGQRLHEQLGEPLLIIKAAWGGRSLHTDFRSPSSGPFVFRDEELEQFRKQGRNVAEILAEKQQATGVAYRDLLQHVQTVLQDLPQAHPAYDPELGFELAGFVWFQGWNDMVDGGVYPRRDQPDGYAEYSRLLANFIRDVRRDLNSPQLPFVIGVMGVGGPTDQYQDGEKRYATTHQNFRNAMAAPALTEEFQGRVVNVLTEIYWDPLLDQLQKRREQMDRQVQREANEQELDRGAIETRRTALRHEKFSDDEWRLLETSVSNQAYHYLGSPKILGRIGAAFADEMLKFLSR